MCHVGDRKGAESSKELVLYQMPIERLNHRAGATPESGLRPPSHPGCRHRWLWPHCLRAFSALPLPHREPGFAQRGGVRRTSGKCGLGCAQERGRGKGAGTQCGNQPEPRSHAGGRCRCHCHGEMRRGAQRRKGPSAASCAGPGLQISLLFSMGFWRTLK